MASLERTRRVCKCGKFWSLRIYFTLTETKAHTFVYFHSWVYFLRSTSTNQSESEHDPGLVQTHNWPAILGSLDRQANYLTTLSTQTLITIFMCENVLVLLWICHCPLSNLDKIFILSKKKRILFSWVSVFCSWPVTNYFKSNLWMFSDVHAQHRPSV